MSNNIVPKELLAAASYEIKKCGAHLECLGAYQGKEAWEVAFPPEMGLSGSPIVYLWNGAVVTRLGGQESLDAYRFAIPTDSV